VCRIQLGIAGKAVPLQDSAISVYRHSCQTFDGAAFRPNSPVDLMTDQRDPVSSLPSRTLEMDEMVGGQARKCPHGGAAREGMEVSDHMHLIVVIRRVCYPQ